LFFLLRASSLSALVGLHSLASQVYPSLASSYFRLLHFSSYVFFLYAVAKEHSKDDSLETGNFGRSKMSGMIDFGLRPAGLSATGASTFERSDHRPGVLACVL